MTQLRQQNQHHDAAEPSSVLARGLKALRVVTGSVAQKAADYIDRLGEKADLEKQLMRLAGSGDVDSLKVLIKTGVDPRTPTQSKFGTAEAWSPLHQALANNDETTSFTLIEAIRQRFSPAEVATALNAPEGQYGDSALMMAVKLGQHQAVRSLLAADADPAQADKQGTTPFMEMCRRGHMEMVKDTLQTLDPGEASVMLHKIDGQGFNSLFHTIAGGASEALKIELLAIHAAHNFDCAGKYGSDGYSAIHVASIVGDPVMIRELVDTHRGDVNSLSTKEGFTPTMAAAWANQPKSVEMLWTYPQLYIDAKRNSNDSTALHIAGVRGNHEVIVALVQCNADLQAKDANNQTPAELAKYLGRNDTAKLLQRLDPHSDANNSLTNTLMQRAGQAINAMKSSARTAPNL